MADNEDVEGILLKLGFTPNEAKVYFALCELGPASASSAAEKCGVNRTLMYDTLSRLVAKGVVSVVTLDKKKVFQAADPSRLQGVFEERAQDLQKNVQSLVETVRSVYSPAPQPNVSVFMGVEGLKTVFTDQIATLKSDDVIRVNRVAAEIARLAPVVVGWWHRKHAEKGIWIHAIVDSSEQGLARGEFFGKQPLTKVKYLPDIFHATMVSQVYGDKVAFLSAAKGEILSIIVESKNVSTFFREEFDRTWAQLPDKPARTANKPNK